MKIGKNRSQHGTANDRIATMTDLSVLYVDKYIGKSDLSWAVMIVSWSVFPSLQKDCFTSPYHLGGSM